MLAAFYRCLYGEDFFESSVRSVIDSVDHVYVLLAKKPWGSQDRCTYRGSTIYFPRIIDGLYIIASDLALEFPDKFTVILAENELNRDMPVWARDRILQWERGTPPSRLLFMEPDMVWRSGALRDFLAEYEQNPSGILTAGQIELWRRLDYRVPHRTGRAGPFLWEISTDPVRRETGAACVHNLGFCVSDRSMFWKHMLGLAISAPLGDTPPDEEWFERKWLTWHETNNNDNLEIARGYSAMLPRAYRVPLEELPEIILNGLSQGYWPWLKERMA